MHRPGDCHNFSLREVSKNNHFVTRLLHASYNGRILGKKSEIRPNAPFWSEFSGIF